MGTVAVDYETFWSKKLKYSIRTQIAEQYCRSPLFDPYIIAVSDGTTSWSGELKHFNWAALEGKHLLAHNRYFDSAITQELVRRGLAPKFLLENRWSCTADMTAYLCNRRSLAAACEHLLGVKTEKDTRDESYGKHWPQDFSPEEQAAMLKYARNDPFRSHELWTRFNHLWPEMEQRLSDLTIRQGQHGVQIDRALLDDYIVKSHAMKMNAEDTLPWLADADDEWEDFLEEADLAAKPTSTKCIAEQCKRSGIPCPPVKKDDPEGYEEWEDTYAPRHAWIQSLSAWRSVNKLYKTFLLVKERLRNDGTMPFALKYFGAHTGRWAGDARINMQNMRRKPLLCNERGMLEMNEKRLVAAYNHFDASKKATGTGIWPEWVKYDIDFRHIIIARPGKKFIVSDLSQIEPRVLNWLAGNEEMLALMRDGMSPYAAHMKTAMKHEGEVDKNSDIYKLAKARVLALGYQAGWEKFIKMSLTLAQVDVTVDDPEFVDETNPLTGEVKQVSGYGSNAKRIVKEFREQSKLIVENMWQRLDLSFKQSLGEDFKLRMPSGRYLTYETVRCERRPEVDKETGQPKMRTVFTAGVGGRRFTFYGGKLTENVTQAVAREVFAWQLANLDAKGIPALFTSHDEGIFEVDKDVPLSDVTEEMSKAPEWMPGLPVACDAKESDHYFK